MKRDDSNSDDDLTLQLDWSAYRDAGMGDAYADIPQHGGNFGKAIAACINSGQCEAGGKQVMCPSYRISGNINLSTGGRVRLLKTALNSSQKNQPLLTPELQNAMDLCVSCKGCKRECESNVDMPLIKAEYLAQKYQQQPRPLRSRLFANLPQLLHQYPWLSQLIRWRNQQPWIRALVDPLLKLNSNVDLPQPDGRKINPVSEPLTDSAADPNNEQTAKTVVLFLDTFTREFEPHIVDASLKVLKAAGYRVKLLQPEKERPYCCGRSWLAQGMIERARQEASRLVNAMLPLVQQGHTIVGLEASCVLGLRDDAQALGLGDSVQQVAKHTFLLEEFLAREAKSGNLKLPLKQPEHDALIHGHCHQKATGAMKSMRRVLKLAPANQFEFIDASCCGMAGSFGLEAEHAQHSRAMAEQGLLPALQQRGERQVIANGFSCRQQIRNHSDAKPRHLAEWLADCIDDEHSEHSEAE